MIIALIYRLIEYYGIHHNIGIIANQLIDNVAIFRKHPLPVRPYEVIILRDPVPEFKGNIKIPDAYNENRTGRGRVVSFGRSIDNINRYDEVLIPRIRGGGTTYLTDPNGYYGGNIEYVIIDINDIMAKIIREEDDNNGNNNT